MSIHAVPIARHIPSEELQLERVHFNFRGRIGNVCRQRNLQDGNRDPRVITGGDRCTALSKWHSYFRASSHVYMHTNSRFFLFEIDKKPSENVRLY